MPFRITTQTIVLYRDGKRVRVPAGQRFEFTSAELKEIQDINKTAVRQPINEMADVQADGAITNLADTDANPNASVPAPVGAATSPEAGAPAAKVQQKAAAKTEKAAASGKQDDEL